MKVFISGQKQFGASVFELCQKLGHEVVGVSAPLFNTAATADDRLRAAAIKAGVRVMPPRVLNAETLPGGVDLIIAAHSHDFIGRRTREKARLGAIGYHPSLLPLYRGRDAVRWQIKLRERVTGGSVYWLSDNMDGGDIAAQEHAFIRGNDDAESLWRNTLFPLGLRLFARVLADLSRNTLVAIPQDDKLATWFPSIERMPVFRPDLPQLGAMAGGVKVLKTHEALADWLTEEMQNARVIKQS